ncbi:MAG: hypothetical protein GF344_00165 [Chitinivibrionales bacterium]|nr:hypothetical protein [Chitinivibrionales bacterium]MBD3355545.1 hypothetical protein [Chitinivibrionales bacterium]
MSRRNTAVIAILLCLTPSFTHSAEQMIGEKDAGVRHPFMLFVTSLRPPQGGRLAAVFSKAVFLELKGHFDTTTYQTILVEDIESAQSMSNHKKDLIIYTDTSDWHVPDSLFSTLILWIKYRTGFLLGRTELRYTKAQLKSLPVMVAEKLSEKIYNEFLGQVSLSGGPPNMTMCLVERLHVTPPCNLLLPAGQHTLISSYDGFARRVDTIDVLPGMITRKRVLLLPEN